MSIRIHAAKVYKVEYDYDDAWFASFDMNDVNGLIDRLAEDICNVSVMRDEYFNDEDVAISVEVAKDIIDGLKSMDNEHFREEYSIPNFSGDHPLTRDEMIWFFEKMLEIADASTGYIHLAWF